MPAAAGRAARRQVGPGTDAVRTAPCASLDQATKTCGSSGLGQDEATRAGARPRLARLAVAINVGSTGSATTNSQLPGALIPYATTSARLARAASFDGTMVVMDAGIAAVLGAAVGTAGTIITGWTSRSLAKTQMRAEGLRERREPRRSSYEAFSSAADALHDHLQPWVKFGRLLGQAGGSGAEATGEVSYLRSSEFKEGYIPRLMELADDVSRYGRHVILDGPAELETYVSRVTELVSGLVAPFRIMQSFSRISNEAGDSAIAYDTSRFPDRLKQLEREIRGFLLHAGTALDDDKATKAP